MEPQFWYCCSVWGCTGSTEINQLQNFTIAARIVTKSSYNPSRPLIERLRWKTIQELVENESETMVFKSLNRLALPYLCNLFTKRSECCSCSLHNTKMDQRQPNEECTKLFFFSRAKLWNNLSAESKQATCK